MKTLGFLKGMVIGLMLTTGVVGSEEKYWGCFFVS